MIVSMAAFAVEDFLLKSLSGALPLGQILIFFGAGGAVCFAALALASGERLWHPDVLSRPMRYRFLYEVTGRLFYILSLTLIPLSTATLILQATPIVVVAGAAIFFRERVSPLRWACIFVGLLGVLIILGPGTEGFSTLTLITVVGVFGFAGRDLASRAAPRTVGALLLGFYGFITVVVAGVAYSLWDSSEFQIPDVATSVYLAALILVGVGAYFTLMKAMRTGEVSFVTPFRYTRLLFGVMLGVVFFNEQLTLIAVVGSTMIVGAGLVLSLSAKSAKGDIKRG